jgi:hypothetical protein
VPQAQAAQLRLKHAPALPSYGQVSNSLKVYRRVIFSSAHLPSALLLLQLRRVASATALCSEEG